MNKRSAMFVAAGLILALVAGAYALALGVTGPAQSASAKTYVHAGPLKTVKIHLLAPSSGGEGAMSAPLHGTVVGNPGPAGSVSYSGSYSTGSPTYTYPSPSAHYYYDDGGSSGGGDD
jgi:hypothetical protein